MHKLIHSILFGVLTLSLMASASAETSKIFKYENQREESFALENKQKETRYKTETVDSTCYKKEPYVQNICRDVTKYREECRWEPSRQECSTRYEQECRTEYRPERECRPVSIPQVCRYETRYRQECTQTGGGQQCHTVPGEVQCHRDPKTGEQKCTKVPPRQVCTNRPSQQVCRQVPYQEYVCNGGGIRQECNDVMRPHQVCTNVPKTYCQTIPAQNVCQQIPYVVNECKDETLYKDVPYACKKEVQVPYEVVTKTHNANVQFVFDGQSAQGVSEFRVDLSPRGLVTLQGRELPGNSAYFFVRKDIKQVDQGELNSIEAIFNVAIFEKAELFDASTNEITGMHLGSKSLSFYVNGKFDKARAALNVNISKKGENKFSRELKPSQFTTKFDGKRTQVYISLSSLGAPKLGGVLNKTHRVSLKLSLDYSDLGELVGGANKSGFVLETSREIDVK